MKPLSRITGVLWLWVAAVSCSAHPLEPRVRELFTEPGRMLRLIPMQLSDAEQMKTVWALHRLFGNATITRVEIKDKDGAATAQDLDITLGSVDLFGLNIATLTISARNVRFDPESLDEGHLIVKQPFEATMEAMVTEDDLNRVSGEYKIQLMADTFRLRGSNKVLFLESSYALDGRLKIGENNRVMLVPKALQYGIVPIPKVLMRRILHGINPLFDFNKFLGSVKHWVNLDLSDPVLVEHKCITRIAGKITPLVEGAPVPVEAVTKPAESAGSLLESAKKPAPVTAATKAVDDDDDEDAREPAEEH